MVVIIVERTCGGNKVRFKAVIVDNTVMYPTLKQLSGLLVWACPFVRPFILAAVKNGFLKFHIHH